MITGQESDVVNFFSTTGKAPIEIDSRKLEWTDVSMRIDSVHGSFVQLHIVRRTSQHASGYFCQSDHVLYTQNTSST